MRRRKAKAPQEAPVKGEIYQRGDGIRWSVIEVDPESVLYEVDGMSSECHTISLDQWNRLVRRGHLVHGPQPRLSA